MSNHLYLKSSKKKLPVGYEEWWMHIANHMGGIYPYYDIEQPGVCSLEINKIIACKEKRDGKLKLDSTALIAKSTLPYLLGDRTLIEGIKKAPWMSYPDQEGDWHAFSLPKHGSQEPEPASFALSLKVALLEEVRSYIKDSKSVGILLSGGMDSRVVAGVVKALQTEMDDSFSVVGLTWGDENSRDVVYARRITERFGWGFHNYEITSDTLYNNIGCMARMGAEISPFHLHAMPQVAMTDGIDVVLAGSYGDSIGRGEFSGRNLKNIKSVFPKNLDSFGIINLDAMKKAKINLLDDLIIKSHIGEDTSVIRRYEIEQQAHYLRRMLQSCMQVIAKEKKFYQVFTSPAVFGQMWSLDASVRNDDWYKHLLLLLPGDLLSIPWARTGKRYDQPDGLADSYSKGYHNYGSWLRTELKQDVLNKVNSETIRGLSFFNESGLNHAIKSWSQASTNGVNRLDELFSWLATLHDFIELHQIKEEKESLKAGFLDNLNALKGGVYGSLYIKIREKIRQ